MKFIYKALKPGGEQIKGEIEAINEQAAKIKIREFGIFPIEVLPYQTPLVQGESKKVLTSRFPQKWRLPILFIVLIVLLSGSFRIYHGGSIGFRIVLKHSFSFKDTIVNIDNIIGMPRIAVAIKHPAVKRQLEEMGIIEADEYVEKRIRKEIEEESERMMKKWEKDAERIMKNY